MMILARTFFCALLVLGLLPVAAIRADDAPDAPPVVAPAEAPLPPIAAAADKTLRVGESDVYEFEGITTTAVGNPAIVDIVPITARRLLVNAKGIGQTTLFVYDKHGKHTLRVAVLPIAPDLGPVAAQVQADIGLPDITVRVIKDTLFLEGEVATVAALQRASAIAGVYAPKVRNLIAVVPPKDDAPQPSLAQTYAALLTANLKDTGIKVQVVDDKTIALLGDYSPPRNGVDESPAEPKATTRATVRSKKRAAGAAATDSVDNTDGTSAPDPILDSTPPKSRASIAPALDPLDRLLQSLPADLRVIDLINIARRPPQQILVHAKIIDIDRNSSKNLGINWGTLSVGASRSGNLDTFMPPPILFGQTASTGQLNYGTGYGLAGGGTLRRVSPFAAQLNLLITENKARILSEPSLMVLDGSEGSILVGGEIPIPVAQGSSGTNGISASVAIEYKPYGVRLLLSAAIVAEGAVQMTVTPEVSELDYGNAIQISGFLVPALTVRRATSTLQMADGETLVIGGLYSNTVSRQVERIPVLSQIPVLGEFFRNTTTHKEENELLILIQPEIVTPDTPRAQPPPSGSLENLPISKPDVGKAEFDKDFPDLQKGGADSVKPGPPVSLPPVLNAAPKTEAAP